MSYNIKDKRKYYEDRRQPLRRSGKLRVQGFVFVFHKKRARIARNSSGKARALAVLENDHQNDEQARYELYYSNS